MKVLRSISNWLAFLLTGKGEIAREAVDNGICDFGGQGRDVYGRRATTGAGGHGHNFDDLSGKTFGIWKVLEFDHMKWNGANHKSGMSYYKCECQKCGRVFVRSRSQLLEAKNIYHRGKCEDYKFRR